MARALPTSSRLRPMLPTDVPLLAEIFRAAIEELTAEDYSRRSRRPGLAADDEEEFGAKLAGELTLVATLAALAVGFAVARRQYQIDMLYVHPAAAGQGAAAMLCDALEKLAAARGAKELTVDASDTASGFFEKRGFTAKTRNTVTVGGEWLANTTMIKPLAGEGDRAMKGPETPFQRHWLYYLILKYARDRRGCRRSRSTPSIASITDE